MSAATGSAALMYDHNFLQNLDEPGMIANPAHGQLNRGTVFFLSPLAPENLFSLDGFGPSRVSPLILHTLKLSLVLICGIPPALCNGVQLYRRTK